MWLAVECKLANMVPYYNSSICYCHHFEHLFLLDQINFNVDILMLCLLVVNLTKTFDIYSLFGQFYCYVGAERQHMLLIVYGSEFYLS